MSCQHPRLTSWSLKSHVKRVQCKESRDVKHYQRQGTKRSAWTSNARVISTESVLIGIWIHQHKCYSRVCEADSALACPLDKIQRALIWCYIIPVVVPYSLQSLVLVNLRICLDVSDRRHGLLRSELRKIVAPCLYKGRTGIKQDSLDIALVLNVYI